MICLRTPACSARAMTASRSALKLSCVRFEPISIKSRLKTQYLVVISSMHMRNILLTALVMAAFAAQAQEGGDTQAQIDYAYQTEDSNSLGNLIQNLSNRVQNDSADTALRYHLAHAQYRFGQLSRERHARAAESAFSDCIDELKPVIDKDVKSPE